MPVHDGALPRGHLRAGQLVVRRGFVGPRLIGADLARVVDHTEDHLLIWFAPETEGALSVATDGRGIRDMPFAEWLRPALTTVAVPKEELGVQAAVLLLRQIDEPGTEVGDVSLPTTLVVRASTGAPSSPSSSSAWATSSCGDGGAA